MKKAENYLIIPDLQVPFEAAKALEFCREIQKEFKVAQKNVLCVGDEVDQYFGSLYDKDPDAKHSPSSEIFQSIKRLKEWFKAFPSVRVAESNHGSRWAKKAQTAGIPSLLMRKYQEVLEAPIGWTWQRQWLIKASHQHFILTHGMGYSGFNAHRQMALNNGLSTVHGHLHSSAGISFFRTHGQMRWGFNSGCLINVKAYAFHYNKDEKFKPTLGCGVILNGGTTPLFIPYEK